MAAQQHQLAELHQLMDHLPQAEMIVQHLTRHILPLHHDQGHFLVGQELRVTVDPLVDRRVVEHLLPCLQQHHHPPLD